MHNLCSKCPGYFAAVKGFLPLERVIKCADCKIEDEKDAEHNVNLCRCDGDRCAWDVGGRSYNALNGWPPRSIEG